MRSGITLKHVRLGLVLAAALAIGGYGVATTAAFHTGGTSVKACVRTDQGQGNLRIVAAGTACLANEETVQLAKGPGATGPTGATGATGPTGGVAGTHVETGAGGTYTATPAGSYFPLTGFGCAAGTLLSLAGVSSAPAAVIVAGTRYTGSNLGELTIANISGTAQTGTVTVTMLCTGP